MSETNYDICLNSIHNKIDTLEKKIDLILKHLNIEFCDEPCETDLLPATECEETEEQIDIATDEVSVITEKESNAPNLTFLRNEINALKSFVKET